MSSALTAVFWGNGRQPKCPPDPAFPDGKPVDITFGAQGCDIDLDHPTPQCGIWIVECPICGLRVALTAAGRPDDPSHIKLPCLPIGAQMQNHNKPILCVDFDGVIHSYTSGWKGADIVPDAPVPGSIAFLRGALETFDVQIFSSRSNQPGGISAMCKWLGYWVLEERLSDDEDLAWAGAIKWPTEKPPALVTIDDRALTFTGNWADFPLADLAAFKPWNKR